MSNVVAKLRDFVSRDDTAEQMLYERQEESQRMANDPDALADIATKALKRHDVLTIQELEDALAAERQEFQLLEQAVRDIIGAFQQECAPLVHQLHSHTANMAALRDMLIKRRHEP